MPSQANDPWPTRNAILEALKKSADYFQEALNLTEKESKLSADNILAIEQAVAKANEIYNSVSWNMVAIKSTEGIPGPTVVMRPLTFKKPPST